MEQMCGGDSKKRITEKNIQLPQLSGVVRAVKRFGGRTHLVRRGQGHFGKGSDFRAEL